MSIAHRAYVYLRWASLFWLLTWLPSNLWAWGWQNLLHFCDVGLVIACVGLWLRNPLLVSSQALLAPFVGVAWSLDVCWRLVTGHHLIGGTEYMWDTRYALWIRLLSLFHVVLPLFLLWAIRVLGYDRRALALETAIAAVLLIFSRSLSPQLNMNYAFQDPLLHRSWGPAPLHLAVILGGCVLIFFLPTHSVLRRIFPRAARPAELGNS